MLCLKVICLAAAILCLMPNQSDESNFPPITVPKNELTIFTTNGTTCYLFRSTIDMEIKNYHRRRAGKKDLTFTTRSICRAQCPKYCNTPEKRVCAEYAGMFVIFPNECELWMISCVTGQSFIKVPNTKCKLDLYEYGYNMYLQ